MLGWEFPPFMSGGLGTAVDGLTKSLVSQGHEVVFVLPHPIPEGHVSHVELVGPRILAERAAALRAGSHTPTPTHKPVQVAAPSASVLSDNAYNDLTAMGLPAKESVIYHKIMHQLETFKASSPSSYPGVDTGDVLHRVIETIQEQRQTRVQSVAPSSSTSPSTSVSQMVPQMGHQVVPQMAPQVETEQFQAVAESSADELAQVIESVLESLGEMGTGSGGYGSDLFGDAQKYARLVAALGMTERFDVIHAHDWLTYPAGMMLKAITGKPLVCHIHATEFDRSGEHINQGVYDIERAGMHGADRVIAVSQINQSNCPQQVWGG